MSRIKNMGSATMRFGEGIIVTGSAGSDKHALIVTGSTNLSTDLSVGGIATYNTVEYFNSNTMKFNQNYLGNANGSYFSANEYQKVLTIIPSANSQNYQVIGRIAAQNAGETHVVNFNAALRSGDPLPDLSWSISYDEEYNGNRYIDPQLWTKETTTAGFIFAFKTLATIYGNVTVDIDVVPRSSSQKANVTINNNVSSEQTSIDSGYTANDMIKAISKKGSAVTINNLTGSITKAVADLEGNRLLGGLYQLDDGLIQNPNSGYSRIYFPADDTLVETVGPVSTNYKIAPFSGELIKMQVKSIQDFTGKALTASLHVGTGTNNSYSATPAVSVALNGQAAHSVYTFDFLGRSGTTFSEANIFGFSLELSENWAGNETIHFTSVIRFNPYA